MVTAMTPRVRGLPEAAHELRVSVDVLRKLLKARPEIDTAIPRLGRNRVVGDEHVELMRRHLAAR